MATLINFKRGFSLLKTHFNATTVPPAIGTLQVTENGNYLTPHQQTTYGIQIDSAEPWVNVTTNQLWVDGMPINVELRLDTSSGGGMSLSDIFIDTYGKAYRTLHIPPAEAAIQPPKYGIVATTSTGHASLGNWASQQNTPATYRASVPNNNVYALVDSSTNGSSVAQPVDISIKHISQIDVAAINDQPVNAKVGSIMKHYNNSNYDMMLHDIVLIDGGLFGGTQTGTNVYNPNGELNRPTHLEFEIRDLFSISPQPNNNSAVAVYGVAWKKASEVNTVATFDSDVRNYLTSTLSESYDASVAGNHRYMDNKSISFTNSLSELAVVLIAGGGGYRFAADTVTIQINDIVCDSYDASHPYFEAGTDYYMTGYLFYDGRFVVSDMILTYHVPA